MPRHSTIATAIDKHKLASTVVYLLMLEVEIVDPVSKDVVEILRLVSNNENFFWRGNTYTASVFTADVVYEQDKIPNVNIVVQDIFQVIQPRLQAYGGMMGSSVRMLVVNASLPNNPPEMDEMFKIISAKANANDYSITFSVGAENPLGLRFPPSMQWRNRCRFVYKGRHCGYTGPLATCDYTFDGDNGCEFHNNSLRFGGFRSLRIPTWGG